MPRALLPPVPPHAPKEVSQDPRRHGDPACGFGDVSALKAPLLHVPKLVKGCRAENKVQGDTPGHGEGQGWRGPQGLGGGGEDFLQLRPPPCFSGAVASRRLLHK